MSLIYRVLPMSLLPAPWPNQGTLKFLGLTVHVWSPLVWILGTLTFNSKRWEQIFALRSTHQVELLSHTVSLNMQPALGFPCGVKEVSSVAWSGAEWGPRLSCPQQVLSADYMDTVYDSD